MNHRPPKKSLKQKLAVALSVVNALNVCAPMALPYVNVAKNVRADGGQAEPLHDGLARAFYGTAQANSQTIPDGTINSAAWTESGGTMYDNDEQTIKDGGTGTVSTMNGGEQIVRGGTGTVNKMINSHARQSISSGSGTVNTMGDGHQFVIGGEGTVVTMSGGDQQVNNGGVGTVTTMNGGEQRVYEGGKGTVNEMTNDNATQDIDGGEGTVNNLSNGNQVVKNGGMGTVINMINSRAHQYIENGGTGTVTRLSGGTQVVRGGGTSLHTTIASGGKQIAAEGAILAGTQAVEAGGVATGGTLTNITVGGTMISAAQNVKNGGTASNITVGSGGMQVVFDGGSADHTTVATSGSQVVSGGRVTSTHVESNAAQHVYGGTVISTTLGGSGACQNLSGGVASGTIINHAGASQNINKGATASNTIISSGTQYVSSGGVASGTTVSGGTQNILSSGTATGTILSGGDQVVNDGGTVTGTTINSGGTQYVSGGRVTDTHVKGNANQYVYGGVVSGTTLDEGDACQTLRGGTAVGTIINAGDAHQVIYAGATANNTIIRGGDQFISAGGTATGTILSGGSQFIDNGGKATGTQIYGGTQRIASGGQATSTTVAERGTQLISSGGTATDTHVLSGGTQNVKRGGIVSGGMVEKGAALAFEDPDDVKGVSGGGGRIIMKDGSVDGGTLIGGEHDVVSGVTVSGMTLEGSAQTIASGGTAVATTISAGAAQTLAAGGTATATTISAGGVQTLQKGTPNAPGGVSEHIAMEGGTLVVDDYARAQLDEAEGGVLRLLDLGLAEAQFGALDVPSSVTNYELTTLYARGDTVRLGLGDGSKSSTVNKTLKIGTLDGYAHFVVNTDLANNKSDQIVIGTATNATQPNTISVNYDPTIAKTGEVPETNTKVATVESGQATFVGAKSTINSIEYLPEVETTDGGKTWYIHHVNKHAGTETHGAVMGMTASMAALSAGNDFIGAATEGLSLTSNAGKDGVSAYAKLGGGAMRQETGSHVNVNTWNAILALGHKNEKEKSAFEYGAFFEYGSGNYTTHDGDYRGDGSVRNTGGGVLAKWTAAHGFYVEGSLRAGTVHDDASSVLRDNAGNAYGYDTNAGYWGAHLGVGKEIPLANGDTVDVYGKFFYNRRNGVSFTANNSNFDLDAVTSEVLRVGARYTMKREKWNFYGGLAYEHELDGKAKGTVNNLEIRGADIGGGSVRAEIGATMQPDKNSPWSLDLNVAGFAGKKQGFSGGVAMSFMF